MCSSTGSERLSAASPQGAEVAARSVLGENAQNQVDEALSLENNQYETASRPTRNGLSGMPFGGLHRRK